MQYDKYMIELNNYLKNKEEMMDKCNHSFVKIDSKDDTKVICVHCGLTNKYENEDNIESLNNLRDSKFNYYYIEDIKMNKRVFKKLLTKNKAFNYFSNEVLETSNVPYLYKRAERLNPDYNVDELFEVMKELNKLELDSYVLQEETDEDLRLLINKDIKVKKIG